jgi:hypothetical protein
VLGKFTLLIVLYGGLSIAALLFVLIGFALAHKRWEVIGIAALAGVLVAAHAVELYFLADMGRAWSGGSSADDLLVTGGIGIALAASATTAVFLFKKI